MNQQSKQFNPDYLHKLYWEENLSMQEIGERLNVSRHIIWNKFKYYGIPLRSRKEAVKLSVAKGRWDERCHRRGVNHPNWKGGRSRRHDGYFSIRINNHPRASKDGRVYEHIYIWEQVHGKPLPDGYVVHHLNGIKDDNRPENLVALPKRKHYHILQAKAKRIRELEAKVRLLEKALEDNQMVFKLEEN